MPVSSGNVEFAKVVGIHGAPRSGTSWIGQLFNSHQNVAYRYQPFFSYAFKDRLTERSSSGEVAEYFRDLAKTEDNFVLQRGDARLASLELDFPKLRPTHLVYKEVRYHFLISHLLAVCPRMAAIGVVRHPCAVINSWLRAPREFRPEWNVQEEWRDAPKKNAGLRENYYGYARWKKLANLFLEIRRLYPERFCILSYSELDRSTEATLEATFTFCGLEMTDQVRGFISRSRSSDDSDPYSVFRKGGRDLAWKSELDKTISDAIEIDLQGSPLEQFLQ